MTAPDIDEKPYKIIFEGKGCIGTGRCAEVSDNWEMSLQTGLARPVSHYVGEEALEHNLEAACVCPARGGDGVIRIVDRRTGEEVEP